jgi:hypothetical protein
MQTHISYANIVVLIGALTGCSSQSSSSACAPENQVRGVCAGVPPAAVCTSDPCTTGVVCAQVVQVGSDAELQAAARGAMAGACIALAPGGYGAVDLPGGVSLLGRAADAVTVGKVTVGAGQGGVLRGLTTAGVHVEGAKGVKIESVLVLGSADTGVLVDAQSSVSLVTSTIEGSARYGLYAVDAADVSLDRVIIAGSGAPGLWVASSADCPAPGAAPTVEVTSSIVRDNHIAGVALFGAKATFQGVDILATVPGDAFHYGMLGGGLSIAACSDVDLKGMRVLDSKSFGVLVDGSAGTIGGSGTDEDIEIQRNVIGLAVQNVMAPFKLEGAQLDQNQGVGINLGGGSQGVIICRSGVTNTVAKSLPVGVGSKDVGDGLVWTDKSSAQISDLSLSGNALASVLIDGEASGLLDQVTLSGGDQTLGIVQQSFMGGMQPTIMDGTPALQVDAGEVHPVPMPPASLPKSL